MPTELTAETERTLERLAQQVVARGLAVPAILFLEMNKPIAFLLGQSVLLGAPALSPFLGVANVEDLAEVLSSRDNVEHLLRRIEHLEAHQPPPTP